MMYQLPDTARINHARYRVLIRTIRMIVGAAVLTVIALVAAASADAASAPATVTLHEQAVVGQGNIYLGQIGDIEAAEELAGQLADVEIGPSPLAGREREINAGYVRMRIARAGFDRNAVSLAGAEAVIVQRPAPARAHVPTPMTHNTAAVTHTSTTPDMPSVEPSAPPPVVIKRGSSVKITVLNGGVTVTTTGQLLDEAAVGEFTTARVKTTSRKVCGVLSSPRDLIVTL